ncbi:hypothetical protein GCM10010964_20180 [Caldovatus sediminis]|uniref:Uncharacterized protein n=1 Tax=Caldovatus sediminis TaxID=2041189 RepID=A0A8J3EC40_9PROT|nr:hypothetical protein [Caldovatus sediminis]GGG32194.1 hypothetical protein GCM10010964_20180 [Caldovatus sediminis]
MASADDLCSPHFSALLLPTGFAAVRARRWVRSTKAMVREVFEIQALKGNRFSARWGFSLDFVPACRNRRLRWKGTDGAADFDLCIDPIDEAGSVPDWCSFSDPSATWRGASKLARVASEAVAAARKDSDAVCSPRDVVRLFERRSTMRFARFGLDDYVQTHLAWGLALIAAGRPAEAEPHISRFCDEFGIARGDPLLAKAAAMASAAATGGGP